MKIEKEINQKGFKNEYQKVFINLLFTTAWITKLNQDQLKPFKISWQQFNILRILKGHQPEAATVKMLGERMIDKMSNASRLVEKLKQKGLVERRSCSQDRRRVDIYITPAGLELVIKASEVVEREIENSLSNLSIAETKLLNELLDKLRG